MPLVKVCPTCSQLSPATAAFCLRDGVSLVAVQPMEEERLGAGLLSSEAEIVCPECSARNQRDSRSCVYCNGAFAEKGVVYTEFEVKWPWGEKTFHHKLRIGREPPAPQFLIKWLKDNGFDNVSRTHADILIENGEIFVEDLGSINGTFLGNERLKAREKQKVGEGVGIRIASNFFCEVKLVNKTITEQSS